MAVNTITAAQLRGAGILNGFIVPAVGQFDPDAQAFITAASITDPTQQSAINTLVVDLKGYNIWTKFKAIYPIVGGVASSHAVNLKTPGTFNLSFATGVTHSANGMVSNGSTGYADTNFTPSTNGMLLNSAHLSFYSRTDLNTYQVEMGNWDNSASTLLLIRQSGNGSVRMNNGAGLVNFANTNAQGFYLSNRTASNVIKAFKNGTSQVTSTLTSNSLPTNKIALLAFNNNGSIEYYSTKQCAFSSIGDGLTDTDAANFYTAVQAYQTTLSRQVGVPIVSDSDAQAFLNAAVIEDVTQANAINDLVIGMKADGLWTKMKAIYPIVGGSASSHKYNLKDPRDLDEAFRLTFSSGWTHSSTGMTPANAYANTSLIESSVLTFNNIHLSIYSRTNSDGNFCDLGSIKGFGFNNVLSGVFPKNSNMFIPRINDENAGISNTISSLGHFISNRISSTELRSRQNGVLKQITVNSVINSQITRSYYIGALNGEGYGLGPLGYSDRQIAFASIGDGLTDTEAANFYTLVNTYQTALSRNV